MESAVLGPVLIFGLVGVALLFDFMNGLHDAANSIATVVSTRVLSPRLAVAWAAFFNFIAFAVFGLHVANTLGTGIVEANVIDPAVIFGALTGAIAWTAITWAWGLPSSSSHALIGGLVGAGVAKAGFDAVVYSGLSMTALGIVISPLLGFVLAQLIAVLVAWVNRKSMPFAIDRRF
ncbi:MAG TPA: inorganic phosphate transporter, partial [Casimicrobiaceae bacterium]